jgi:hypothetical protein
MACGFFDPVVAMGAEGAATNAPDRCNDMSAIVSEARNQPIDGLLSVIQLGPKVIHFDFDRNLMTWKE